MANFFLILSKPETGKVELTCAVAGENDRWQGRTREFDGLADAEVALRAARVLPIVGPNQHLTAANSSITVAFKVEQAAAVSLQVLHRSDPQRKQLRAYLRFHDRNGGAIGLTKDTWLGKELQVGDKIDLDTPLGSRTVEILKINRAEDKQFGSDETRREYDVEVTV